MGGQGSQGIAGPKERLGSRLMHSVEVLARLDGSLAWWNGTRHVMNDPTWMSALLGVGPLA